jgi:hypothetical protein
MWCWVLVVVGNDDLSPPVILFLLGYSLFELDGAFPNRL